jgi:hypothetical protein
MRIDLKFLIGLIIGVIVGISMSTQYLNANTEDEENIAGNLPQVIQAVDMNKDYNFAGERLPDNFDVKERLDRELSVNAYWQSSTLLNLKTAQRYFPMMERVLAEHGIPQDFKYLAVAESNLRNVSSSANAKGFWQFRKLAGKEMGLEINDEVDERYHAEKATIAACKYIKQLYNRFGSWTNAAAAYNVGPTNFSRTLRDQGEENFYDLNLNSETSRYLFRLIAFKEIMSEPEKYGYFINDDEKYPMWNTYDVLIEKSVPSWSKFAKNHGITYRLLKVYNPWLRDNKLTVINNKYKIKIPRRTN